MIKYLGSKRLLIPAILQTIGEHDGVRHVLDLFSGTSRVGHALKGAGYRVTANDHNAYAATLARCHVQADAERWAGPAERLLAELDALPGDPGWFTATYCEQSRFFRPENGARVDAIREAIARMDLEPELAAIALTALMEAADRVDSTTGVQMAYLKDWAPRSRNRLTLRLPELQPGVGAPCAALELDALTAAQEAADVDAVYLDPPYNQHKYLGNYHIWESLVRWDKPEVYGKACKRVDCRERRSPFNSRPRFHAAMDALLGALRAPLLVVSFSDEGYLPRDEAEALFAEHGRVSVRGHDYPRYVGARIGIHNPEGQRVGEVGHLRNTEYLYVIER